MPPCGPLLVTCSGRSGAAFQWWIPLLAGLTCLGSFIAWAVLVVRGRDATTRAMDEMGVSFPWWVAARRIIAATAVLYPIFVALALAVSVWRARLARSLDIHRPGARPAALGAGFFCLGVCLDRWPPWRSALVCPRCTLRPAYQHTFVHLPPPPPHTKNKTDSQWLARCRAFQVANAVSSVLLWLMLATLVGFVAGHAVWGYMAQMADIVGGRALVLVGPVWASVGRVADTSRALTDRVTGLLGSLPAVGGRRLLEEVAAGAAAAGVDDATVASLLAVGGGAGAGAAGGARALQQTGLLDGLGQLAAGIANGIAAATNAIPAAIPGIPANATIPGLPQLLPNGTANPLVGAISDVTRAIEEQIINPTGCPIYCIDLRTESWWVDARAGCLCNLDRVAAALPHLNRAWRAALPAVGALFFMYAGATWLLLHGASQWARTRNEAKLMARIPGAAAAAAENAAAKAGGSGGGGGGFVAPPPAPAVV